MIIKGAKHKLAAPVKKVEEPAAAPIIPQEEEILPIEEEILLPLVEEKLEEELLSSKNRYKNVRILPVEDEVFADLDIDLDE